MQDDTAVQYGKVVASHLLADVLAVSRHVFLRQFVGQRCGECAQQFDQHHLEMHGRPIVVAVTLAHGLRLHLCHCCTYYYARQRLANARDFCTNILYAPVRIQDADRLAAVVNHTDAKLIVIVTP